MYLTTLLYISSCVYLITCCLVPEEMSDLTAQFLSIITTLPDGSYSSIITHVSKSVLLSIRFIVLFTILGVNALYEIFKKREIIPPINRKKTKKNVTDTPIMQSTAGLTLKSKSEKITEPMTVTSAGNNNNNNNNNSIIKSASNQIEPAKSVLTTKPIIVKNSSLSTVVHPTLAQDQLTKDENLLSAISINNNNNNNQHVTSSLSLSPIVDQPTMVQPEESIPSLKSDDGEEDEEENNNLITQDNKESSDQYYSNMIKKDNNLMSFSDKLQRVFEEPSTPVPLNKSIIVSNNKHYYNEDNNRPRSIQTRFEEGNVVTTTPALTPTNPTSSTVSRKSSMASQKSTLKGMFNSAFHKSSRKSSIKSHHSSDPQQQQQQQQTMMPEIHDLTASTSTKRLSRLSTFRLGRKKSTASNTSRPAAQSENVPVKPVKEKSSFTSNMKNKFKKTGEKIQNIVHKKA
ncbi:hypothetical protein BD770DRAFT_377216 [Pilaira anomala]|nr:hypothetical protein BD770DRAFT_377216 [Pilaira anomala]